MVAALVVVTGFVSEVVVLLAVVSVVWLRVSTVSNWFVLLLSLSVGVVRCRVVVCFLLLQLFLLLRSRAPACSAQSVTLLSEGDSDDHQAQNRRELSCSG